MRRLTIALVLVCLVAVQAEPLGDLLRQWAADYVPVSEDARKLGDAVQDRYPDLYYRFDDLAVDTFCTSPDTGTWARFDYSVFEFLRTEIKRSADASVPDINPWLKTVQVANFYDDKSFQTTARRFSRLLLTLGEVALLIKEQDSGFISSCPPLRSDGYLESWTPWYETTVRIESLKVDRALADFRIRYGPASDKLNIVELAFTKWVPWFRGTENGPSACEPILRFAPVCYDATDNKFIKTVQVGTNYYFLSGCPGFYRWLHHLGASFVIADAVSDRVYKLDVSNLSYGVMLHIGKYQVGAVMDTQSNWKFITTINFKVIPGVF